MSAAADAARRRRAAEQEEEDPELKANKGALFGSRRSAVADGSSSESKQAPPSEKKETDAQASRRSEAESQAVLKALADEMGGLDADNAELDELMRAADGGDESGAAGSELDLTTTEVDFDGVDSDLARFQADPLVMEALRAGVDLRAYSAGIERDLAKLEQLCVEDYVSLARPGSAALSAGSAEAGAEGADSLSALHGQLANCDGILESMEKMLTHFQSDLSTICGEIQSLQHKSYGMGVKLKNYKAAEKALHAFVDRAYIDDSVANAITNDKTKAPGGAGPDKEQPLDERFVVALQDLDVKLTFLTEQAQQAAARDQSTGGGHVRRGSRSGSPALAAPPASMPPAARDMAPLAEKLRLHAVARSRAFLLERFHSLGVKRTNIQIKQQSLLKFAPLYQFLLHHADERGNTAGTGGGVAGVGRAGSSSSLGVPGTPSATGSLPPLSPGGTSSGLDICGEIRRAYHDTLSKIYESKFERYLKEIGKLAAENSVRAKDTLGSDEGGLSGSSGSSSGAAGGDAGGGGMFSSFFGGRKSDAPVDPFRLGNRDEVLTSGAGAGLDGSTGGAGAAGDGDLIVPHLASSAGTKLSFERLFKSATALLMDTATSEYDFIVEFFGEKMQRDMDRAGMHEDALAAEKEAATAASTSAASASPAAKTSGYAPVEERGRAGLLPLSRDKDLFKLVFRATEGLFLRHLDKYLSGCHDALSVLLLIRVVCQHNIAMQYRRVHCLDALFDRMNMTLWPKFKQIFDANVKSVIDLDAHPPAKEGGRRPHPLCTRYADFASGILRLNRGYDDAILTTNLARLSREVNEFLKRSAALAPSPRMQLVYVLNSYRTIMAVLAAGGSGSSSSAAASRAGSAGLVDSDEYHFWQSMSDEQIDEYVRLELHDKFGGVLRTIQPVEKIWKQPRAPNVTFPPELRAPVETAVKEFLATWNAGVGLAEIHKRIHESFGYDGAAALATKGGAAASGAAKGGGAAVGSSASASSSGAAASVGRVPGEPSLVRAVFIKVVFELVGVSSRLTVLAKDASITLDLNQGLPNLTHFKQAIVDKAPCCAI